MTMTPQPNPRTRIDDLADEIAEIEAHLSSATYRQLVAIREFDDMKGWAEQGAVSCAAWLTWRIGLGPEAARDRVRIARALEKLPQVSESLAKGALSYSKVRAVTRIATPENEDEWLNIALSSTGAQMEKIVRCCRQAEACNAPNHDRLQREARQLMTYYDEDGMLVVKGRLPSEVGKVVEQALNNIQQQLWEQVRGESPDAQASHPQRRADALVEMAERAQAAPHSTQREDGSQSKGIGADRYQVVLHVDAGTLAASHRGATPRCELEKGPRVTAEAARTIACDASKVEITHGKEGEVLSVGRKTRVIPTALRRAMEARDQGCRAPGCTHRRVDGHHVTHWADGGETKLSNIVSLCKRHHTAIHEGVLSVEARTTKGGATEFVFRDRGGNVLDSGSGLPKMAARLEERNASVGLPALVQRHTSLGLSLHPQTLTCGWDGERVDYGYIAEVMTWSPKPWHNPGAR
jgi:hypothetical protein